MATKEEIREALSKLSTENKKKFKDNPEQGRAFIKAVGDKIDAANKPSIGKSIVEGAGKAAKSIGSGIKNAAISTLNQTTSPEISTLNPLALSPSSGFIGAASTKEGFKNLDKGAGQTAVGMVRGVTGGLSRFPEEFIEKKTGIEFPEPNAAGTILGAIGGPFQLASGVSKLVGLGAKEGVKQGLLKGGAKLATEGFVGAGLSPTVEGRELDVETRLGQGVLGAAANVGIGSIVSAVKSGHAYWKSGREIKKLNTEKAVLENAAKKEQLPRTNRNNEVVDRLDDIKKETAVLEGQQKVHLDNQINILDNQLKKVNNKTSISMKAPIKKEIKSMKDQWASEGDELLANADEIGMTHGEMTGIADDVLKELDAKGFVISDKAIKGMYKIINQFNKRGNVPLTNTEVIRVKKQIAQQVSAKARNKGLFSQDDVLDTAFNNKLGLKLEANIPGYKKWNSGYGRIKDLEEFAVNKIGINEGAINSPGGKVLLKVSKGNADSGDVFMIRSLEKATGKSFTGPQSKIIKQMDDLQNAPRGERVAALKKLDDEVVKLKQEQRALRSKTNISKSKLTAKEIKLNDKINKLIELRNDGSFWGELAIKIGSGVGIATGFALADSLVGSNIRRFLGASVDAGHG